MMGGTISMTQPELVLFVANAYDGIREEPRDSNNVVFNTRYYGRAVSGAGYPWCMAFVWDVFRAAGLSRLFYGGDRTASCSALMLWAKAQGLFVTKGFQPADVLFFDWTGDKRPDVAQHTGFFKAWSGADAVTVEGNTAVGNDSNGGQVMGRVRAPAFITGAFRPKWDTAAAEKPEGDDMTQTRFNEMADQYFRDRAAKPQSKWSEEAGSWDRAAGLKVFDGTAPQGIFTREQAATVLDRLDLLKPIQQYPSPAFVNRAD